MKDPEAKDQFRKLLVGIFALAIWSTSMAPIRSISEQLGTFTSAIYSYLIGGGLGFLYILSSKGRFTKLRSLPVKYLMYCGGLFTFYNVCIYIAIGMAASRLQVLGITVVNYIWPSLMLVFGVLILKKNVRIVLLLPGLLIALSGVYFAAIRDDDVSFASFLAEVGSSPAPYFLTMAGAACWGLYSVLTNLWKERHGVTDGHLIVPGVSLLSGLIMLIAKPLFPEASTWSAHAVLELLYVSLFPLLLAYLLWTMATQQAEIASLSIAAMFLPLASTLMNCCYFAIKPDRTLLLACVLTIAGAALCKTSVRDRGQVS